MISEKIRRSGIGGTDVAAILGADSRRDAFSVWAEKRGNFERGPATARMRLGKIFERAIVSYYSELTGRPTDFVDETRRSTRADWIVYTPDALCRGELRGVDAKFVSWDQRQRWGATPDDIPPEIQLQVTWYLLATGFPYWDVIAVLGSEEPLIYTFERDLAFEDDVLYQVEEFYRRYIEGDERPEIGSSEASTRWLREQFPKHRADIRPATPEEIVRLENYAGVRADEKALEKERVRLENEIKLAIGDGEGLSWSGGRFTWKLTKDSERTDWEALSGALLSRLDASTREAVLAEFTVSRPGVRRIYFRYDGEAR